MSLGKGLDRLQLVFEDVIWVNIRIVLERPDYVVQVTKLWISPSPDPADNRRAYLVQRDETRDCAHIHWSRAHFKNF